MVLNKAWGIYKENWKLYISIVLLVGIALAFIKGGTLYLSFNYRHIEAYKDIYKLMLVILNLILWIGHLVWIAPLNYSLNKWQRGIKINVKKAFSTLGENFSRVAILASVITGIFIIFVIPTYFGVKLFVVIASWLIIIFFLVIYALFIPIWFTEDKSFKESLLYSRQLLTGKRLNFIFELIAICILFWVLSFLLSLIVAWPINKLSAISSAYMYISMFIVVFVDYMVKILLCSFIIVWLYCYYKELKELVVQTDIALIEDN